MSGFIVDGQPYEAPESGAQEAYAQTPPASGGFLSMVKDSSPVMWLSRAAERGQARDASFVDRALNDLFTNPAAYGDIGSTGTPVPERPKEDLLDPAEANKRFAHPGVTLFDAPVSPTLARIVSDQKMQEIQRQSVLSRYEGAHSLPVNFATGVAAFMLDPLNFATTFLPGIGEEAVAARLGGGILARTAARAIGAGTAGVAAQAPLSVLRMGLSAEESADYGWRQALRDVAFAAAGGALLHSGLGGLREAGVLKPDEMMRTAVQHFPGIGADAATKADAMKAAVGTMADERPVETEPIMAAARAAPQGAAGAAKAQREAANQAVEGEYTRFAGGPDFYKDGANPREAYERAMASVPEDVRDRYLVHGISATRGGTRIEALAGILRDKPDSLNAGPVLPTNEQMGTGTLATRTDAPYLLIYEHGKPMADGPAMVIVNSPDLSVVAKVKAAFPGERIVSPEEAAQIMRGPSDASSRPPAVAPITVATPRAPVAPDQFGGETRTVAPQSLLSFLVSRGGIQDQGGELTARNAHRQRPGLVNNRSGASLDYAREAAEEQGFIKNNSDTNDLLAAIDEELAGRKVYRGGDIAKGLAVDNAAAAEREGDRLAGAREEIRAWADEAGTTLTPEEVDGAARLTLFEGMHPQEAVENVSRSSQDILHEEVTRQRAMLGNGWSQGLPDDEFRATSEALYGEHEPVEQEPAAAPKPEAGQDQELAAAEARAADLYSRLPAEDRAALDATATGMSSTLLREAAYQEAAACLSGVPEAIAAETPNA